jgi:hypothetical protein
LNLITLAFILFLFTVEYMRETFMINRSVCTLHPSSMHASSIPLPALTANNRAPAPCSLDVDEDKIDGHLLKNVFSKGKYPKLQEDLRWSASPLP